MGLYPSVGAHIIYYNSAAEEVHDVGVSGAQEQTRETPRFRAMWPLEPSVTASSSIMQ